MNLEDYKKLINDEIADFCYMNGVQNAHDKDYMNDLNAMHEAEMLLSESQQDHLYALIWEMARQTVKNKSCPNISAGWAVYNATAMQRATTFIQVISE